MLFKEQGYKAQSIADASTLIGWSSVITNAKYVQGWCHSNATVTIELCRADSKHRKPRDPASVALCLAELWHGHRRLLQSQER
jgi:hypothetical protein